MHDISFFSYISLNILIISIATLKKNSVTRARFYNEWHTYRYDTRNSCSKWQHLASVNAQFAFRLYTFRGTSKRPVAIRRTFNPQLKLLLIYQRWKVERLSWSEQMWVINLLKVIICRKSGTARIWTFTDPEIGMLTTQPPRLILYLNFGEHCYLLVSSNNSLTKRFNNSCLICYIVGFDCIHLTFI